MTISIRAATADDLDAVAALKIAAVRRAYTSISRPDELDQWIERRCRLDALQAKLDSADGQLLVAERDGELAGMAYISISGHIAKLSELYCAGDSTGVGRALMDARLDIARAAGCRTATCYCFAGNTRAQTFLAHAGFQIEREVPATDAFSASALLLLAKTLDGPAATAA